ncbi:RNA polymerase sigma-70 factor (sigma-E family) [Kibdelosporangium banguiense]|uniref:RNA polymerase sigma-70 factor (Sigma-E family) n=1 Tax=Kibdelosporangium banguiense TaxID=1365924 RepID=A0ABS4T7E5_9PSEU|nr:SigE family RNA polymerase sigma factor [Kibdelosporangium banguiense]MBP2320344.1 RNA polymerase sigma-70 factor (sigma-E family) [Kibdelosporangium banguiense]
MTFDKFVESRSPALLRYATVLTGDPHMAEDVVQEVLIRAHRKWSRISSLDLPETYVRRMITNQFLSWRRRKSSGDMSFAPGEMPGLEPVLADPTSQYDDRAELSARIGELPRAQQAVLVLRYFCDLPDNEIADVMGCRSSTVRAYASRALATLRTTTVKGVR